MPDPDVLLPIKLNSKLSGVDVVVVHNNLSKEDGALIKGHGVKVYIHTHVVHTYTHTRGTYISGTYIRQ